MEAYINGIGIISRCAYSKEELKKALSVSEPEINPVPLDFPTQIPSAKLRRNSRYNKLACAAADQALKDAGIPEMIESGSLECHQTGTIISTGYGAAEYSSVFADSVVKGDPALCSPSVFSGSVPNSCVGQICIINKLKGFSTVLAGGDPLEYACLLLKTGRAEYLLSGSVEEYFPPLYDAVEASDAAKGCILAEGAAFAVLSVKRTDESYCRINGFAGINLGACPYIHRFKDPEKAQDSISSTLKCFAEPNACFISSNGTWFDQAEENAVTKIFGDIPVIKPKTIFGESLGCGYMMNVTAAACCIQQGDYTRILVTGIDMIGNYTCVMLESIDK